MKYRKQPLKTSSSSATLFLDCEQKFAYERLIANVPMYDTPIQLIYGQVIHKGHERIWNLALTSDHPPAPTIIQYWLSYLKNVFEGVHGPEGESLSPKPIRWLTPMQIADLSQTEIAKKINLMKESYMGNAYLALRSIYLEATGSNLFSKTEIEYDFGVKNLTIKAPGGDFEYLISGRIDRLQFLNNGDYIILDLKTGPAQQIYQRSRLMSDTQMTLYQFACEKLFGRRPIQIYIQPVNMSNKHLETFGAKALTMIRIPVEIREDPVHFENLAALIDDERQVLNLVINADRYSDREKNNWEPRSVQGKLARFKDNVTQGRFMPRIGSWCNSCQYIEKCQEDNVHDWANYREKLGVKIEPPVQTQPKIVAKLPATLFDLGKTRYSALLAKSDRQIKQDIQASGEFVAIKKIPALINKITKLTPLTDSRPCFCRRLGFVPLSILENLREYLIGNLNITNLFNTCRYRNCPLNTKYRV